MSSAYIERRNDARSAGIMGDSVVGGFCWGRCLRDAVTVLVTAQVAGDQFGQQANRYHLGAEEQGGQGVNQERPLVQRQEGVGISQADHPGDAEVEQTETAEQEANQTEAAQ